MAGKEDVVVSINRTCLSVEVGLTDGKLLQNETFVLTTYAIEWREDTSVSLYLKQFQPAASQLYLSVT